eukprot:GHVT01042123.1.p1 GENE.GHVT01042123.1~~GHVT01042123.1.p1  ORF type:complete len:371 (+),score=66.64 GHVT01042123.1:477-1589(+)
MMVGTSAVTSQRVTATQPEAISRIDPALSSLDVLTNSTTSPQVIFSNCGGCEDAIVRPRNPNMLPPDDATLPEQYLASIHCDPAEWLSLMHSALSLFPRLQGLFSEGDLLSIQQRLQTFDFAHSSCPPPSSASLAFSDISIPGKNLAAVAAASSVRQLRPVFPTAGPPSAAAACPAALLQPSSSGASCSAALSSSFPPGPFLGGSREFSSAPSRVASAERSAGSAFCGSDRFRYVGLYEDLLPRFSQLQYLMGLDSPVLPVGAAPQQSATRPVAAAPTEVFSDGRCASLFSPTSMRDLVVWQPAFLLRRIGIAYEDDDIIVVDKPFDVRIDLPRPDKQSSECPEVATVLPIHSAPRRALGPRMPIPSHST